MRALLFVGCSLATIASCGPAAAQRATAPDRPTLLFRVSADHTTAADVAGGEAVPNFQSHVAVVPTGKSGGALQWEDDGYVAWKAPGNIYARAGTLGFFWRARTPVGPGC